MRTVSKLSSLLVVLVAASVATADGGPDYWRVKDLPAGQTLTVREQPSSEAPAVGEIPAGGRDIKNLGCQNAPSFTEWAKMSEAERQAAAQQRWCKVGFGAVEGWVNGRQLVEDSGSPAGAAAAPAGE